MAESRPQSAAAHGLTVSAVNHYTLPVRDHDKSRQFWVSILGGEVRREPDWERVRAGRSNSTALAVRMCEGPELDLFYQPFGAPAPDQMYPSHAYLVQSAEELDAFRARLEATGVPTVLVTEDQSPQPGQPCAVSLCFNDPDGNHVGIECRHYPFHQDVHVGSFDPWDLAYSWRDWPGPREEGA